MSCQCQGVQELFSEKYVMKDLADYRKKGSAKTTCMLVDAIRKAGASGLTLLDIGGGVGAVQHELLASGVAQVTSVEASPAYLAASQAEAFRRGIADRVSYIQGNFTDLAAGIPPADIVTLDRVICCYDDMEELVATSAERARKIFGLVYPRDTWWLKFGLNIGNLFFRLRKCPYRAFTHPTEAVEAVIKRSGLKLSSYRRTLIWQVAVYTR
jgi:2-polyprenyl-3-methyl-5-hydroxy-6-metoxy-1,4-benzoquinol methylase